MLYWGYPDSPEERSGTWEEAIMVKWAMLFVAVVLGKFLVDIWRGRRLPAGGLDRFDFKAAKAREFTAR